MRGSTPSYPTKRGLEPAPSAVEGRGTQLQIDGKLSRCCCSSPQFKVRVVSRMNEEPPHALIELIGALARHGQYLGGVIEFVQELEPAGRNFVSKESKCAERVNDCVHPFRFMPCGQDLALNPLVGNNVGSLHEIQQEVLDSWNANGRLRQQGIEGKRGVLLLTG